MGLLRRLRAALGIGVTWAVGWSLAGALAFGLIWLDLEPYQTERLSAAGLALALTSVMSFAAVLGLAAGTGFAGMLGYAEHRRTIADLSMFRTAILGAAAGGGLYVVSSSLFGIMGGSISATGIFAVFGAASAAGTLRVARRGAIASGDELPSLPMRDDEAFQAQ